MRSIKGLDPKYTENVNFYIVGSGPGQTLESLEADRANQGYPWPVAEMAGNGRRDLGVIAQSTKIAIDGNGASTYRDSFGRGNIDTWRQTLADLGGVSS